MFIMLHLTFYLKDIFMKQRTIKKVSLCLKQEEKTKIKNYQIILVRLLILLAANPVSIGGTKGKLEITGGNIYGDLSNSPTPVNQFNVPVFKKVVSEDTYSKKIETEEGSYHYIAHSSKIFDDIYVYIPKFCNEIEYTGE